MISRITLCLLLCTVQWAHADVEIITKPRPGDEYVILSSGQKTPSKVIPANSGSKISLKNKHRPVLTTAAPPTDKNNFDYIPINFDNIDDINSGLLPSNVNLETAGSEQKQHSRIQIKKGPNGQDYEYEYIYYYYDEDEEGNKDGKVKENSESTTESVTRNSHDGPLKTDTENHIANESKTKSKYSTIDRSGTTTTTTVAPEIQNEVLPASGRGRGRGRNIPPPPVEEEVEEDISIRLPSSTRFPPRGRNLASTSTTLSVPEVSSETVRHRGRQVDSVADESSDQTRSRTRSHIRRPSSELVDLDSFKTNSGDIPSQYKEPPTRYSSEIKSTTEDIPEEEPSAIEPKESVREGHSLLSGIKFQEIVDDSKLPDDYIQTTPYEQDTTEYTTMTAMEKVALDLYAYLAGENLNNEINPTSNDLISLDELTTVDDDTWTTEALSTTEELTTPPTTTTTSTTTTTTTTTTPAPTTTTTTTVAPTRPSRFKGRIGARSRVSTSSTTVTEAPQETSTRVRGRFSKPNGVRKAVATTAADASTPASTVAEKSTTKAFGRRGLFAGRTRPSSTTAAPVEDGSASASETPAPRARLRPGLRRTSTTTTTVGTTVAPSDDSTSSSTTSAEVIETTPIPARTLGRGRPGVRPAQLRPGPRLNLRPNPRLRPIASSVAPAEENPASEAPAETPVPESPATEAEGEGSSPTPAPEQQRGGVKLRNRLQVSPSPKPRVAVTPLPRRPNPLLKRKLASPTTEVTTEASKKSTETFEEATSAEKSETETEPQPVVETTQAPPLRGLDALKARRRAAGGIGGRPARPARGAYYNPK